LNSCVDCGPRQPSDAPKLCLRRRCAAGHKAGESAREGLPTHSG
jgi:hypothetical protein